MNKYKLITVDKSGDNPTEELEIAVNKFIGFNLGYFANTPPVVIGEHLVQMLISDVREWPR